MTEPKIYILNGHDAVPVRFDDYIRWWDQFEGNDDVVNAVQVAHDMVLDTSNAEVHVSTVFHIGTIHYESSGSITPTNRPPFETMIFGGEYALWSRRYWTWDEAAAGHLQVMLAINNGTDPGTL